MTDASSSQKLQKTSARQLCMLFHVDEKTSDEWSDHDLASMFRKQLDAPITYDLQTAEYARCSEETRAALSTTKRMEERTFRDILFDPKPRLDLLSAAKEFFKERLGSSEAGKRSPEEDFAYSLYLLTILVARLRRGKCISGLTNAQLLTGTKWCLNRKWISPEAARVLKEVRKLL